MFYRLKYLLATTIMLCVTLPPKVVFSQSELTNVEKNNASQQNLPVKQEQLRKTALQLYQAGEQNYQQSNYQEALEKFQQALPILQQIGDRSGEAATLNYIGQIYFNLKQYAKASEFLNAALTSNWGRIRKRVPDYGRFPKVKPDATANPLPNEPFVHTAAPGIGETLPSESESKPATDVGIGNTLPSESPSPSLFQQDSVNVGNTLSIQPQAQPCISCSYTPIGDTISIINESDKKELNGAIKNNLGLAYLYQGKYNEAEELIYQALDFFRKINRKIEQGNTLNNLAELYRHRSQYPKSLEYLNQAKAIFTRNKNQLGIGTTMNNIGLVHDELGEHHQALKHYQYSLAIRRKIKDKHGIGTSLHNIGFIHDRLEEYDTALEFYQQALKVHHQVNNRGAKASTLNNMGLIHNKLGRNTLALQYLKQSKYIFQKLNYPSSEANTLDSLGTVYRSQGEYKQASEAYHKALAISHKIENRTLERIILSNIGDLLTEKKQPELAIVFYKQSVKITEEIRKGLQSLPLEQQKSYTKTVTDTYRNLASLLLKQNRIQEAQQVLDLLKVQEVEDYLHNTRQTKAQRLENYLINRPVTNKKITILQPELKIIQKYHQQSKTAIELGQELSQLQEIPEKKRTKVQRKRIFELVLIQQDLNKQFNQFAKQKDILHLLEKLTPEARNQIVDIKSLDALRDDLRRLNAVIIYPLILDNRLELIITTPDSPPLRRTVNIKSSELNQEIINFRQALQNRHSDIKISAKRLYNLLIKPLEQDLNQANPKTIIYAPDGKLRYIPLAALHNGNQWLIERYQVNNITAKSLTDFTAEPKPLKKVLAGAFGKGKYNIEIGQRIFPFAQLPFTLPEVENLANIVPQTKTLINHQFSKNAVLSSMNEHDVLHFATHAAFVPEDASQSFILFGNGEKATITEIGNWTLNNVDLVVLSACETGLGGKLGNGEEILGLGYQFQNRGVRATIASLWRVSDGATKTLMSEFYSNALKSDVTKSEALRQAQIALIKDDGSAVGVNNRSIFKISQDDSPQVKTKKFQHPYYWAPFILIGNGF
ncbi:MAG: CHAT domain-containing protein [Rivularia sp. (in: Bacteria)]|nr:CHAT domain-containing protein [Rivularia sp. MS3]